MSFVAGNDPPPSKRSGGSLISWLFLLLVFGPTIYRVLRNATAGVISDQQLLIIGGGLIALIGVIVIVQRINRSRADGGPRLPTPMPPPAPRRSAPPPDIGAVRRVTGASSQPYLPPAPRFEPMITGKVVLASLIFGAFLAGIGVLLLGLP